DERGELASRDIVSRAIFNYKKEHQEDVYLDFNMFDAKFFAKRFPNITHTFASIGYHFPKDRVPISPAFHYSVGGIKSNLDGSIDGVESLYVIGEAANTGVHGANRLASNSLLEGVVFAKQVSDLILSKEPRDSKVPKFDKEYDLHRENDKKFKHQLRKIMWEDIGIIRTKEGLLKAKNFIYDLKSRDIGRLLELRLNTATAIVQAALARKSSLGTHYRES
ncbi:MAG: FAD-binding protein, partial [Campylobacterota bacterium]|nr:FAD-binding protein [Campylobacterota bacterium]